MDTEQIGIKTLEKRLIRSDSGTSLRIGLPRETVRDERRISLTPGGVATLCINNHQVIVEKDAGSHARFSDQEYSEAGAEIVEDASELYRNSELIVKVALPTAEEAEWLQPGQILISTIHLGTLREELLKSMIARGICGIGYEFMMDEEGEFPLVRMMHEITGSLAVQIAVRYLENSTGGQGILPGGVTGIQPATVVILGAGVIGEYAARIALGYGARVFVMDQDLARLRRLENALDRRIITLMANHQQLSTVLLHTDILIGAVMAEGEISPCWVTEPMVASMKEGSVIVDTVIDQGGCIATSRPTSHSDPVYTRHGVIHYCVPNIPSNVARTATHSLNNVLLPYLLAIGDAGGISPCLWTNPVLRHGTYIYKKHLTKRSLAERFDLPWRDIEMLIASRI